MYGTTHIHIIHIMRKISFDCVLYLVMHKPPGLGVGGRKTSRFAGSDTRYSSSMTVCQVHEGCRSIPGRYEYDYSYKNERYECTRYCITYLQQYYSKYFIDSTEWVASTRTIPLISEETIQQKTKEPKRYHCVPQYKDHA